MLLAASLLTLASCTPEQATVSPPPARVTPSTTAPPSSPTPTLKVSLNVAFGSVYGHTGEPHCPNWFDHHDAVVLTQARLTYTATEISRMGSGVNQKVFTYNTLDPSLLAVEPGVTTGSPPTTQPGDVASLRMSPGCMFSLEITNTATDTVQISKVGLRITQSPSPNTTQYRMVEFCSIVHSSTFCGPVVGGPPPSCSVYGAELELSDQPAGTDLLQPPGQVDGITGHTCPEVTLGPNKSVTIIVGAYSKSALIYQATPILHVITPSGEGTVAFPVLAGVFAYADPSQFACYRLQGSTFQLWKQGAAAYDFVANASVNAWCV